MALGGSLRVSRKEAQSRRLLIRRRSPERLNATLHASLRAMVLPLGLVARFCTSLLETKAPSHHRASLAWTPREVSKFRVLPWGVSPSPTPSSAGLFRRRARGSEAMSLSPLDQGFGIVWIVGKDELRARLDDVGRIDPVMVVCRAGALARSD